MNRDGFQVPVDGFYQIAPLGEFAHAQAGLVQVVDRDACEAMVNRFQEESKAPNFAGLLVDFDHFSLDGEKRSEAAGWITALENRDGGLFAKIRWSDVGEEAVKGGRYRFLSPVWARSDCTDLGNGRVRPMRLLNAAVTNDPNLKGMQPLSNSAPTVGVPRFQWVLGDTKDGRHCPSCSRLAGQVHTMAEWDAAGLRPGSTGLCCKGCQCSLVETSEGSRGTLANTGWTNEARQASIEVRRAKAATRKERASDRQRESMDRASKDYSAIFEQKGLDGMTAEELDYLTARVGQRVRNGSALTPTEERFVREVRARDGGRNAGIGGTIVKNRTDEVVANIGWTDAARAASLAVRRAKAALRQALHPQPQGGGSGAGGPVKVEQMSPADQEAHQADVAEGAQSAAEDITGGAAGATQQGSTDSRSGDMEGVFQEQGLDGMTTDQVIRFKDQIRDKLESGTEPLTPAEEGFLDAVTEKSRQDVQKDLKQYTPEQAQAIQKRIDQKMQRGESLSKEDQDYLELSNPENDGINRENADDPIVQWQMHRQQQKQRIQRETGMDANAAEAKAQDIQMRLDAGDAVSADERTFLDKMQRVIVQNRGDFYGDDAPYIRVLVNTGWTDASRVAALAVRRAKSVARGTAGDEELGGTGQVMWTKGMVGGRSVVLPGASVGTPVLPPSKQPAAGNTRRVVLPETQPVVPVSGDGKVYTGGTPYFDEGTGRRITPGAPATPAKGTPQPITLPGRPSSSDPLVLKLQAAQAKAKRRV